MSSEFLILASVAIPTIGAILIPFFHRQPNLRETVTLITAVLLFVTVMNLLVDVLGGARPEITVWQVTPALAFAFRIEPLGMLFASIASTLWIINSVYSIGYMRGNNEKRQTPFYVCFAVALAATMGLAFSANLFSLFIFYEILTISTYPLVAHKRDQEAMRGGRIYLLMLIGASLMLLLPAILVTYMLAGTFDFVAGGSLAGKAEGVVIAVLLAMFAFGIGKAGIMPGHFWLPAAMVAPTPVSALLHAVAVVKAGVFCILKVVIYVFGIDSLRLSGQGDWLIWVAAFTILGASIVAVMQDNLKKRLAYSTVSQLSYIVLAAALATTAAVQGGALHIAMHAAGKITLFFCAGAIYVATHKINVSDLDGLARRMPFTFFAFFIGALCVIGIPPAGGIWSKWMIMSGALDAGQVLVLGVLMLSTLLNIAYLLPPVIRAVMLPPKDGYSGGIQEAPLPSVLALSVTASFCIMLFFGAGAVLTLIDGIQLR